MQLAKRHFKLRGQASIASLLVCLILLLDAMAASPTLHELIHKDAGKADHDCAVTMFAHGKVDSVSVEISPVMPSAAVAPPCLTGISVFAPAIENLPAGRAPPLLPTVS